jgi:hypothetical protein
MLKKVTLGVVTVLFVVALSGVTMAAALVYTPGIDHYTCYKVKDVTATKMANVPGVTLDNAVESATVEVKGKMKWACAPTDKNGEGILDVDEWLCAYKLKSTKLTSPPTQVLTNQFQLPASVEIKKSDLLLVPCVDPSALPLP